MKTKVSLKNSNILITQSQIKNYSGSEIVTLELAEYFSMQGANVTILTTYADKPILKDFRNLKNVSVAVTNTGAARSIDIAKFDILWVHHSTMTTEMIDQIVALDHTQRPLVIFHHMSAIEPLEFPIAYEFERACADIVLFNSPETMKIVTDHGADFGERALVLGNPAPDSFFEESRVHPEPVKERVENIAVISNHPPKEVIEAARLLRGEGINVDFVGRVDGGEAKRVDTNLLGEYDAIISIGKTVQYCILHNTPIYCYDRFGGSGFVNKSNYALNKNRNFSGRGFEEKSPQQIVKEIKSDYARTVQSIAQVHELYSNEYLLSNRIQEVLNVKLERNSYKFNEVDISMYKNYVQILTKIFPRSLRYTYEYEPLRDKFEESTATHNEDIRLLKAKVNSLATQLEDIRKTKILRLHNKLKAVLKPRK